MEFVFPNLKTFSLRLAGFLAMTWSLLLGGNPKANAAETSSELKNRRCATRLSIAILGKSPSIGLLQDPNPQSQVDQLLNESDFKEHFARFLNSRFNSTPGANPSEDVVYYMAKHILLNNLPWRDLFIGPYNIDPLPMGSTAEPTIRNDANGLGYFRTPSWVSRYAGNELEGVRLSAAFRMMNNTLGLKVSAESLPPNADSSTNGRSVEPCRSCHFDKWYALDKAASVLGKVTRANNIVSIVPYLEGPKEMLGGVMVQNERDFVRQLVSSPNFVVHSCRLVFEFLYGRVENACEASVFDACVETLKSDQASIVAALAGVAKSPAYCQ